MTFTNKFKVIKKFYTIFLVTILFFNTILVCNLNATSFKISEIEISEDFDLKFDKTKVFDKAFKLAFDQLTSIIVTTEDKKKIGDTNLSTIKSLIDSFNVDDEKFIQDKYIVKINVNFNKKNTYDYFESKNIFPSMPNKINLLALPILIDNINDEVYLFGENPIFNNWNKDIKKYHLLNYLLPTEDIEDTQIIKKNISAIEEFKFNEIIKKYDLSNYVILIIYQNKKEINVLSKLQLNKTYKIFNIKYADVDINDEESILKLIINLKTVYEDEWKKLNLINTSIKLPITITLASKNYDKIQLFENLIESLDLVSDFKVLSFSNEKIYYKIVYNGSPNKFFDEIKGSNLIIVKEDQVWKVK